MKKITFMLSMVIGLSAMAQYHEVNWTTLGANPRLGNDEDEQPSAYLASNYTGWSDILTSGATGWSTMQTVPFPFKFNGNTETSFYAHASGIVTFASSPAAIGSSPSSLPSASVPDKSVCMIGLSLAGSNDGVVQKTFGTAPYRQHWIMWASASSATSTVGWTYWSIVLEESTNHIYIVDQRTYNGNVSLLAGIQVNSSTFTPATGYPALNSVTQATSGNGSDPSDNKIFAFVNNASGMQANDAVGQRYVEPAYLQVNTGAALKGELVNYGTSAITSVKVAFNVDGGATQTATISGLNAATGQRVAFTTPANTYTPSTVGTKSVKMWFQEVNGGADAEHVNDTIYGEITVLSTVIPRQVLAEEFTSSTCAPCASFNPGYKAILDANNVNTVNGKVNAVKYQMNWPSPGTDPNYNNDGLTRRTFYGVSGVPNPFLDGFDGLYTQTDIDNLGQVPAGMDIDGEWNVSGTTMTVDVDVTPGTTVSNSNLRLFIAVTENTILPANYPGYAVTNGETEFHQVMRKMLPNGDGISLGALTSGVQVSKTESYTFTFGSVTQGSYNLWDSFGNVTVVAWIQDISTGEVFQSAVIPGNNIGLNELEKQYGLMVYPNPAHGQTFVGINAENDENASLSVMNTLGQVVLVKDVTLNPGKNAIPVDVSNFAAGLYMVNVKIGNDVVTTKLTVE